MLAHGVGSGKTMLQITLAMEMRRIGTAKKPWIVVQASTLSQFAATFKTLYPRAAMLVAALRKRDRATKDTTTDIDSLTPEQREAQLDDLELRDISDHKLRKVLRDLDLQTSRLSQDDQACEQGEATAI